MGNEDGLLEWHLGFLMALPILAGLVRAHGNPILASEIFRMHHLYLESRALLDGRQVSQTANILLEDITMYKMYDIKTYRRQSL